MNYRVINVSYWKSKNPQINFQNDEIVELSEDLAAQGLLFGAIDPIEELPIVEYKEPEFKCEICQKVCKNQMGLKAHMRSHK